MSGSILLRGSAIGTRRPAPASSRSLSREPAAAPQKASAPVERTLVPRTQPDPDSDMVVIHVRDETRKVNRDFQCPRTVLLSQMRYFRNYLTEASAFDDIDISVHCDCHIFEWLMRFVESPDDPPPLGVCGVWNASICVTGVQM
jgi:hypothetical protein